jgi:hypothetical protein
MRKLILAICFMVCIFCIGSIAMSTPPQQTPPTLEIGKAYSMDGMYVVTSKLDGIIAASPTSTELIYIYTNTNFLNRQLLDGYSGKYLGLEKFTTAANPNNYTSLRTFKMIER